MYERPVLVTVISLVSYKYAHDWRVRLVFLRKLNISNLRNNFFFSGPFEPLIIEKKTLFFDIFLCVERVFFSQTTITT